MAVIGGIIGTAIAVCIAAELGPHLHLFGGIALGAGLSFLGYVLGNTLQ